MKPIFFKNQREFREWLDKNHAKMDEIFIGFYKKDSGCNGMTYKEAIDEALCFGWIDGVRHSIDEISYSNRFTPRKKKSNWSAVNVSRVEELKALGQMTQAGLKAYESRDPVNPAGYSYEERPQTLSTELEKRFKLNKTAWEFFNSQPPGYRRTIIFWVVSAKREETRVKRLDQLITASSKLKRLE